jgi:hypothetical protein
MPVLDRVFRHPPTVAMLDAAVMAAADFHPFTCRSRRMRDWRQIYQNR